MNEPTHLQACPQCKQDLEQFRASLGPSTPLKLCPNCQFPVVLVAGKYQLEQLLGEGAFGKVYLARHIHLQQDAERAIKFVKLDIAAKAGLTERFMREVQVTSSVSQRNEHIVRVYDDFGQIHGVGHFYVMEYLQGNSLADLVLDPAELPDLSTCFHIFSQICKGLSAAHEAGIVHRDIKPENVVLIKRSGDPYFAKVVDFGIARPLDEEAQSLNLTQGIIGTPLYMAPEQCSRKPIDARTDIYSLGAVLFEMLVGHPPFMKPGSNLTPFEMLTSHLMQAPPSPRRLRPDRNIPEALEVAILKALEKKPENRYQSMMDFWNATKASFASLSATTEYGEFLRSSPIQPPPEILPPTKGQPTTEGLFSAWPSVVVKEDTASNPELSASKVSTQAPSSPTPPSKSLGMAKPSSHSAEAYAETLSQMAEPSAPKRWPIIFIPVIALLIVGGWWLASPPSSAQRSEQIKRVDAADSKGATLAGQRPVTPAPSAQIPPPARRIQEEPKRTEPRAIQPQPTPARVETPSPSRRTRRVSKRKTHHAHKQRINETSQKASNSGALGCPDIPFLPCVKVSIRPQDLDTKIRILKGRGSVRQGRGGTCVCFAATETPYIRAEALHYRPCTVKLSHRSLYQRWTLKRTNPDELEEGQNDYCK